MIVQPASTNPRGPARRVLRVLGLTVPVVLLVGVVVAGLAGPRAEPPAGERSPAPDASVEAAREPRPVPSGIPASPLSPFPDAVADLSVRSVAEARPVLAAATGQPLAIAGWLTRLATDPECTAADGDTRRLLSPLCERTARLVVADPEAPDAFAHLHVRVPAGVRLPPPFEWPGAQNADPVAVIIVGRAAGPGDSCVDSVRGCREAFVADRVAWAAGEPFDPGTVFDAGLEVPLADVAYRRRDVAESLAAGASGTVLVSAVLRSGTVAAIDPEAATALAGAPKSKGLVWYVRALQTAYAPGRFPPGDDPARLVWVLVDEETGTVLGTGISGPLASVATAPSATPPATAPPATVANLRVRQVDDVLPAVPGDGGGRVVAVTGYLRAWVDPQRCTAPIPGLPALGCEREAILAAEPWTTEGPGDAHPQGAHLHAVIPPGVVVPEAAVDISGGSASAMRVIILGRSGAASAGCADHRVTCRDPLSIERVTWADGASLPLGRQVARPLAAPAGDAVAADPEAAAARTMGLVTALLRVVLVEPQDLASVDATAAAAVGETGAWHEPVWYLRGVEVPGQPPGGPPYNREAASIRWAVVDQATGTVIASSPDRG